MTLSRKNVGETWRFLFNIAAVIVASCQEAHLKKGYGSKWARRIAQLVYTSQP
ncbi:hypothetical protein BS47DRAFT_1337489 [Hydnum rufescens UP504]|uniref:Uncharacterized protein n=1 Tax=Hydnum rufescens UP504 TaxID=1448309 RepID=A0A9P6DY95_9AGAM|nr:hypothetical protein BS47DRAFT_1337489 [Hydnum rufescens UP504]